MSEKTVRVQLLLTGDELMSGDTVDSNSAMIAQHLAKQGLAPSRRVTLGDDRRRLIAELETICASADVLLINGGLGPTVDDLTAQVVAEAAGIALVEHPQALTQLRDWCEQRGLQVNAANRKQAILPQGCELIDNPVGSAPGFSAEVQGCLVICTPGVPGELRAMLPALSSLLAARFPVSQQRLVLRLQTFGIGESTAQQLVDDHHPDWPASVALSFRAGAPQLEIKLSVENEAALPERAACREKLEALFGDHIIGEGDIRLAGRVIELAREQGRQISCAESCTGGSIAAMITQIAGASEVFPGGIVSYSNALKKRLLGVRESTLEQHGAVSEETVREMLLGVLQATDADLAVAVSGIAGPGGGSADKPTGTAWLAWGDANSIETVCLCWPVERMLFQTMVSAAGLDMLRRRLAGIPGEPHYFERRRVRS
ncbi:MAG: nicotinamide-nucleotide amidase [Halieaceae bacterium]|jgi:nicotinamide-nucleotide amidase